MKSKENGYDTGMSMKIITFGSVPPEWGGPVAGGVASYVRTLLTALNDHSDQVSEVTLVPNALRRPGMGLPPKVALRPYAAKDRAPSRMMAILDGFDLALFHHLTNPWTIAYAESGEKQRAACVVHSWTALLAKPDLLEQINGIIETLDVLIFPSHHVIEQGKALGVRLPPAVSVVYAPPLLDPALPPAFASLDTDLLFVGQLLPIKQPELLLQAFADLPGARRLAFVGEGQLRPELEAQVAQAGLGARVHFSGQVSPEEVRHWMRRSRVLCVPSRSESFGLVYAEALSQGLPIIGFAPSVREIGQCMGVTIGAGFTGQDPDRLGALLAAMLTAPWDRRLLARRTRSAFSLTQMASAFEQAIH